MTRIHTAPSSDAADAAPSPSGPAGSKGPSRSALLIVFLVVFIDLLGFGIVLPLLPIYASDLLGPLLPGDGNRAVRGLLMGLLMSSFSVMQFVFAPIWGRISDRIGRRPILLLGLGGSVIFYALFGMASELGGTGALGIAVALLFVARIGAGVAGATIATAQAVIADVTPVDSRARGMALIGAAFGIGFTFGPLFGFASLFIDFAGAPGFAAALLSLVSLALAVVLLPETLRPENAAHHRRWLDWRGMRLVLQDRSVGGLILIFFLATVAFGSLESTLALVNKVLITNQPIDRIEIVTREEMRLTGQNNFLVFAYVGLVLLLMQGFVYRRLVQRIGEVRFLKAGAVFMTLGLVGAIGILGWRNEIGHRGITLAAALVILTLAVVGFACLTPSLQSLISRRSSPSIQGEVLGVNQSASALARIIGPMVALTLFTLTPSHVLPFVLGAGLLLVVCLLSTRIRAE